MTNGDAGRLSFLILTPIMPIINDLNLEKTGVKYEIIGNFRPTKGADGKHNQSIGARKRRTMRGGGRMFFVDLLRTV